MSIVSLVTKYTLISQLLNEIIHVYLQCPTFSNGNCSRWILLERVRELRPQLSACSSVPSKCIHSSLAEKLSCLHKDARIVSAFNAKKSSSLHWKSCNCTKCLHRESSFGKIFANDIVFRGRHFLLPAIWIAWWKDYQTQNWFISLTGVGINEIEEGGDSSQSGNTFFVFVDCGTRKLRSLTSMTKKLQCKRFEWHKPAILYDSS